MPKAFQWTREQLRLLGTMTDMEVGAEIGLSHSVVCVKRQALGIPAFGGGRPPAPCDPAAADAAGRPLHELLGVVRDVELAERFGISTYRIRRLRCALGRPAVGAPPRCSDRIDPDDFGRIPDAEIARKVGISAQRVNALRRLRGIPACPTTAGPRAWPAEHVAMLGRVHDRVVAARTGRTAAAVYAMRKKLGIGAKAAPAPRASANRPWTQAEVDLLGTMSDAKVAARIGVATSTVRRARAALEIAPSRPARRRPG